MDLKLETKYVFPINNFNMNLLQRWNLYCSVGCAERTHYAGRSFHSEYGRWWHSSTTWIQEVSSLSQNTLVLVRNRLFSFEFIFKVEKESMHTIVYAAISSTECRSCYSYTFAERSNGDASLAGEGVSMHLLGNDQGTYEAIKNAPFISNSNVHRCS